jgi:dipeptidyl aminopeptidase/acylaminoacyl peptidase
MTPRFFLRHPLRGLCLVLASVAVVGVPLSGIHGQTWDPDSILAAERYVTPPDTIVQAVLAPRYLNVSLSNANADGSWFLEGVGDGPPSAAVLAKPFHELGGAFIDFAANRNRTLTIRSDAGLGLHPLQGQPVDVQIPSGARVSNASWSPDGRQVAFFVHTDDATHIYVADVPSGRSRQLTRTPVLATHLTTFDWTEDGRYIVTVLPPENRRPMPRASVVPSGPQVKINEDGRNNVRTYPSLLATPFDQDLLEWHLTGQLSLIQVDNRRVTSVGQPAMIQGVSPSHDGQYLRVTRTTKPFSYIVPTGSFGRVEELWDRSGNVLDTLNTTPLNTGIRTGPQQGGPGGPGADDQDARRGFMWAPDGNGLIYLEQEPAPDSAAADSAAAQGAQEEGRAGSRNRRMDRVIRWIPPFDSTSTEVLYETSARMVSASFSRDMSILFASERTGQTTHAYAVFLNDPEEKHTIFRWDSDKFYENPGTLVFDGPSLGGGGAFRGAAGGGSRTVRVSQDGEHVFLSGTQYAENPEEVAPRAFIDRVNIRSGEKTRIYEGDNEGVFERPLAILDLEAGRLVVSRESSTEVPQSFLREGASLTRLTSNVDHTPDLTHAEKHRITITRPDGFKLLVSVMLPPGHRPGTRLPGMFWFYPREYTSQESFDERLRTYNKNSFQNFGTRSIQYLARLGYAVIEPESPIVGEEGRMNDNYVHDLRNNLSAVIDTLDARGWIHRGRLGIGGHSYGAFSTANAMVHTPFFKAGIAGDGNYNRTLTPLSFQSERRDFWTAQSVYLNMSPFLYANNLTGALLLYHGLHDQNVGTFPIHSPRLFEALNGLGKDVAMYLYPWEDHGPAAEETLLDLWARWAAWLDKWVKNPRVAEEVEGS